METACKPAQDTFSQCPIHFRAIGLFKKKRKERSSNGSQTRIRYEDLSLAFGRQQGGAVRYIKSQPTTYFNKDATAQLFTFVCAIVVILEDMGN